MKRYRVFNHTADLGLQVFGKTAEEVFANGANALFDLLTDLEEVRLVEERTISAAGSDRQELWINYLRACLDLYFSTGLVMPACVILSLDQSQVKARLRGELFDPTRHRIKQEIKAVTYHQASVQKTAQGWEGMVILDV